MDTFEAEAVRLALHKMFRESGHFSICTVRTCLETAGIVPPTKEMRALEPLHCVNWSDMTPEMRHEVARRVLALLSYPETDLDELARPLIGGDPREASSLFQRLLGRGTLDA